MRHLRLGLAFLAASLAMLSAPTARAQSTSAFNVVCKDGTIVSGSADKSACETHGGAYTIVPNRGNPPASASGSSSAPPRR